MPNNADEKCFKLKQACQHISLFVALTFYTIIGGLVFKSLEYNAHIEKIENYNKTLLIKRIEFIKKASNTTDERLISIELQEYEKIVQISLKNGIKIDTTEKQIVQWTFFQAIFFCSSVLTTIGYGNIVPSTTGGKAFCIIFALIGIPLTLTVITDLGKMFAIPVVAIGKKMPPLPAKLKLTLLSRSRKTTSYAILSVCFLFVYLAAGAGLFVIWEEDWTFFDGFYFCFVTMTTIGFGDIIPKRPNYMLFCIIYILVGLAVTSTIIELVRRQYAQSWKQLQALRGPLAENLRRLATTPGVDMLTLLTHQDILKGLAIELFQAPVARLSINRKSRREKKWSEALDIVIKQIAARNKNSEMSQRQIIIFESSV